jgi:hypothetical protein
MVVKTQIVPTTITVHETKTQVVTSVQQLTYTSIATSVQVVPTTRVWVSTEVIDKTKIQEHTLTATETKTQTNIYTQTNTETDTATKTLKETQTNFVTSIQLSTVVQPTTYTSVWVSTAVINNVRLYASYFPRPDADRNSRHRLSRRRRPPRSPPSWHPFKLLPRRKQRQIMSPRRILSRRSNLRLWLRFGCRQKPKTMWVSVSDLWRMVWN